MGRTLLLLLANVSPTLALLASGQHASVDSEATLQAAITTPETTLITAGWHS